MIDWVRKSEQNSGLEPFLILPWTHGRKDEQIFQETYVGGRRCIAAKRVQ